jgi:5'-3' exonuclease
VVTGDRDLFQLVDDSRGTRLLYCGRGVAKLEDADDALVLAKYGVPARWYADFAAMRGDPSDGLPGVAGVGDKTAARLVSRYGGISSILAALDDPDSGFAPGVRAKLEAARDYLAAALPVCQVALDVKLPDFDPAMPRSPRDPDALLALAERWNLAGSARRLVDALAAG